MFPARDLRDAWADSLEILYGALHYAEFYNVVPKFWGSLFKKFLGAKNVQNLKRFRSTSTFGNEYLPNGLGNSKSVSYSFDSDFSRVE